MTIQKTRKFKGYTAFVEYLRYQEYETPGKLATLLLTRFSASLDGTAFIRAPEGVENGAWREGSWTELSRRLERDGILVSVHTAPDKWNPRFKAGRRLNGYINKDKLGSEPLVTRAEMEFALAALRSETDSKLALRDGLLQKLCRKTDIPYDPPDYDEAAKMLNLEDDLFSEAG